ncbi:MAG: hypothetical protein GW917_01905 [Bdellovibrionales bacterium]|nr:hypothetical protein [Bdellovibrionales bacterium]
MSAAKKINFDENLVLNAIQSLMDGQTSACHPRNPFYDLDLEILVRLDSLKSFELSSLVDLFGPRLTHHKYEITNLKYKQNLLDQLKGNLESFGMSQSLVGDALSCADELITNSIFNAPFESGMDRSTKNVEIPGSRPIQIEVSDAESDVVLSCTDPFGSLKYQPYFEKIMSCYQKGLADSINYGLGGSGIGSFMVLERVLSLIIGLAPGKRTSFYCRFPKKMSLKVKNSLPKNLIAFTKGD